MIARRTRKDFRAGVEFLPSKAIPGLIHPLVSMPPTGESHPIIIAPCRPQDHTGPIMAIIAQKNDPGISNDVRPV
jgi:hypothetical protein